MAMAVDVDFDAVCGGAGIVVAITDRALADVGAAGARNTEALASTISVCITAIGAPPTAFICASSAYDFVSGISGAVASAAAAARIGCFDFLWFTHVSFDSIFMPKAFSTKAKKAQLAAKRERIRSNRAENTESSIASEPGYSQTNSGIGAGSNSSKTNTSITTAAIVVPDSNHGGSGSVDEFLASLNPQSQTRNHTRIHPSSRNPPGPTTALPDQNKLISVFAKLTHEEIILRKKLAQLPLVRVPKSSLEIGFNDLYIPGNVISFPQRPQWFKGESKKTVESREERVFAEWLSKIYATHSPVELSYFEHNLEVWRQLWRVVEISDIILFVVDARHPVLHFPPTLFDYVVTRHQKHLVLVFNKIDLVDSSTLEAWTAYFLAQFPGINIASFSVYPREAHLRSNNVPNSSILATRTKIDKRIKRYVRAVGVEQILRACRNVELFDAKGNLVDWETMIQEEESKKAKQEAAEEQRRKSEQDSERSTMKSVEASSYDFHGGGGTGRKTRHRLQREKNLQENAAALKNLADNQDEFSDEDDNDDDDANVSDGDINKESDASNSINELDPRTDMITIGLIGHPLSTALSSHINVGKSSLINGILGKKVVSTSSTPGHTKHFQTIHLTKTVRLCDCPGLVFPAVLPKPIQILSGMYKIAQVQEPYSAIQFLAEHVPIEKVLNLHPPLESTGKGTGVKSSFNNSNDQDATTKAQKERSNTLASYQWSAWDICEAFAIQRGFLTPRVARPDVYRAANLLLRMANDGRLLLGFKPPGYFAAQQTSETAKYTADNEFMQMRADGNRGGEKKGRMQKSNVVAEAVAGNEFISEDDDDVVNEKSVNRKNAFELLSLADE